MKVTAKKNPIISKLGVCDPHIHIFNDRAYLYATHDAPIGENFFDMYDWEIWSSADLVNWERESVVRPEDTSMGPSNKCWATDAAERNGKYYFYVSHGMKETYVLESDDPGKGFEDRLGRPLLPENLTPTYSYDPAVFTDDDGQSYIVFGYLEYYIAKLNEDMTSLADVPQKLDLKDCRADQPFIHKHNGIYYLTWADNYATSTSIYGPYTERGRLNLSYDHGSFFEWNEQWFMAFTMFEAFGKTRRATALAYIHFRENGEMVADQLIREYGVGQYDASWNRIEAEWFMKGYQTNKVENEYSNFSVELKEGSWVEYPNIHNIPENPWLIINAVAEEDVDIEVYVDGVLKGIHTKPQSSFQEGEFKYFYTSIRLELPEGTHSLRLVAKGNVKLNCIQFSDNT